MKIDSEKNDFIVEELDDQTLVIKEGMLQILKMRLDEVHSTFHFATVMPFFLKSSVTAMSLDARLTIFYTGFERNAAAAG